MPKGVPNKRYTPEIKKLIVETMLKEKLSHRKTARQFEVNDKQVAAWERIYLTEGPEGFAIERRDHPSPPQLDLSARRAAAGDPAGVRDCNLSKGGRAGVSGPEVLPDKQKNPPGQHLGGFFVSFAHFPVCPLYALPTLRDGWRPGAYRACRRPALRPSVGRAPPPSQTVHLRR